MAFDKNKYDNEYKRQAYDRITILVPKGKSKDVKALAASHGKSVSGLIVDMLETQYKLDLSKADGE